MLSCKEVAKLASEGLDRRLPIRQRLSLWMHLRMCQGCERYAKSLRALKKIASYYFKKVDQLTIFQVSLSREEKDAMKAALRRQ